MNYMHNIQKIFRRTTTGIKSFMLEANPNLTEDSSDAEKYAAFVQALVSDDVSAMNKLLFKP